LKCEQPFALNGTSPWNDAESAWGDSGEQKAHEKTSQALHKGAFDICMDVLSAADDNGIANTGVPTANNVAVEEEAIVGLNGRTAEHLEYMHAQYLKITQGGGNNGQGVSGGSGDWNKT